MVSTLAEKGKPMEVARRNLLKRSAAFIVAASAGLAVSAADDPLPPGNDGPSKRAILDVVNATTNRVSPKFVPETERIVTFDQDGTLWVEHPMGRQPYAAFGNSTGDRQMLECTKAGSGERLAMILLHDDADREYAYGPAQGLPDTKVGTFSQALYDEAKSKGWVVIGMKNDWRHVLS
jgi:hypothetical protein